MVIPDYRVYIQGIRRDVLILETAIHQEMHVCQQVLLSSGIPYRIARGTSTSSDNDYCSGDPISWTIAIDYLRRCNASMERVPCEITL
jgi:hypothetical protein